MAIDPLQCIIEVVEQKGILNLILPKAANLRYSLYADGAAIFCHPIGIGVGSVTQALEFLWGLLRPQNKRFKDGNILIRLDSSVVTQLLQNFLGKICKFPAKYLGLPLHVRKLRRLPGWKGRLLSTSGRETLVNTVLSSQPIYHMTTFPEQKCLIRKIDRLRRSFLSRGETPDKVHGGHSLVNWPTACILKIKGGLGILDLEHFTRALRLRWLWFQWKLKDRAWNELELPCDWRNRNFFAAPMVVTIGDGKTARFWTSS